MDNLLSADWLLAGPRGRRLCFQLVCLLDDDVRVAAYYAAIPFDEISGSNKAYFVLIDDGDVRRTEQIQPPLGITNNLERFVNTLNKATFREPTEYELIHAFADVTAYARYWQPPDSEDLLIATPEVVEALRPAAELIAASPAVSWWTTPVYRPEQWIAKRGQAIRSGNAEPLDAWQADLIRQEQEFQKRIAKNPIYNLSGKWWSTPDNWDIPATARAISGFGPVHLYLEEDANSNDAAYGQAYRISENAAVFEIRQPEDWVELCRRYPIAVNSKCHDWSSTTGAQPAQWLQPDWAAVAGDYAGVHLTAVAYLAGAGRALYLHDGAATVLAGFNPDTTYWLHGLANIATPIKTPKYFPPLKWD